MDVKKACSYLLENEEYTKYIKYCFHKIAFLVYDEIYLYVWLICLYNIFLLMLLLIQFFILLKIWKQLLYSPQYQQQQNLF